jgi:CheY-like chemotaxis protein
MDKPTPAAGELAARYRASLADKLTELSLAWERWLAHPDHDEAKTQYEQLVHRLAGSAPLHGLVDLGRHAAIVDERFAAWNAETPVLREELTELCRQVSVPTENLLRTLVRAARDTGGDESEVPAHRPAPSLYVVLVEDDLDQADYWRDALAACALRVRSVPDWPALQAELVMQQPDALVIDYWLRSETAAEVARELADVPEFARIPKVCLTVDSGPVPRQIAMTAGFAAVVRKSVAPADLADLLRQIVALSRAR